LKTVGWDGNPRCSSATVTPSCFSDACREEFGLTLCPFSLSRDSIRGILGNVGGGRFSESHEAKEGDEFVPAMVRFCWQPVRTGSPLLLHVIGSPPNLNYSLCHSFRISVKCFIRQLLSLALFCRKS
jgi:hypothetical protein